MPNLYEAVYSYAATINNINPAAFAALFSDTGAVHDPVGSPPWVGPDGAGRFLEQFVPLLKSVHMRPGKIQINGTHVAFSWAMEATAKNGRTAAADGIDVIVYNAEGKIERVYGYWDPAPFLAILTAS